MHWLQRMVGSRSAAYSVLNTMGRHVASLDLTGRLVTMVANLGRPKIAVSIGEFAANYFWRIIFGELLGLPGPTGQPGGAFDLRTSRIRARPMGVSGNLILAAANSVTSDGTGSPQFQSLMNSRCHLSRALLRGVSDEFFRCFFVAV